MPTTTTEFIITLPYTPTPPRDWGEIDASFTMNVDHDVCACSQCKATIQRGALMRFRPERPPVTGPQPYPTISGVCFPQCATCAGKELLPIWDEDQATMGRQWKDWERKHSDEAEDLGLR